MTIRSFVRSERAVLYLRLTVTRLVQLCTDVKSMQLLRDLLRVSQQKLRRDSSDLEAAVVKELYWIASEMELCGELEFASRIRKAPGLCNDCARDCAQTDDMEDLHDGKCIDRIRSLWQLAVEVATFQYSRFGDMVSPPELILEVAPWGNGDAGPELHSAITGRCRYLDNNGSLASAVRLVLAFDDVDWDTYLSVPYVLFHEVVVHAFQGASGQRRVEASPDDCFSDGWMDWVAVMMMKHAIAERLSSLDHDVFIFAHDILAQAEAHSVFLSKPRFGPQSNTPSLRSRIQRRVRGRMAAQLFYQHLGNFLDSNEDPWQIALEISLRLNLLDVSTGTESVHATRDRFATGIFAELTCESCPARNSAIAEAVKTYVQGRNITGFLESLSPLDRPAHSHIVLHGQRAPLDDESTRAR